MSVHEKILEEAIKREAMWHNRFNHHPEYWEDEGMRQILYRAEEDVEKLRRLVKLEKRSV